MANCTYFDSTNISQYILSLRWTYQASNTFVLFLKSNKHEGNVLHVQQNTTDPAQGMHLELHTWYPYENSERCNPAEGTVLVKVFKGRIFARYLKSIMIRIFTNVQLQCM
jgi:hypothetical protein